MTIAFTQIAKLLALLLVVAASVDARRLSEVPQGRIINGADAPKDRYPWIVLYLFNNEQTQCGGSLIVRRDMDSRIVKNSQHI